MYICTFTVTYYGTSGNELPPPPARSVVHSVLGDEPLAVFKERMKREGMAIRDLLNSQTVAPYSCSPSCDWAISPVGSISELVRQIA